MRINVIGSGPAGLYFAILMKKQDPAHDITVVERDGPDDTFGWGIVFSETTLDNFAQHDRESYDTFLGALQKRDQVVVHHRGEVIRIGSNALASSASLNTFRSAAIWRTVFPLESRMSRVTLLAALVR